MTTGDERHPTWLRVVLVVLPVVAVLVGLAVGIVTYDAWSDPGAASPAPTTTPPATPATPAPEAPVPSLG